MSWFAVAIIPPILYAVGNYIDKALLSKQLKGGGVGTILIFSCFLGALTLPIVYFLGPNVFAINPITAFILSINGSLTVLAVLFYLYAIEHDEITTVVPILQLTPVFGFLTGYIFLGETLNLYQTIGSLAIVIGAIIISFDISEGGQLTIKKKVLILTAMSALVFSISGTIFKLFALDEGYWRTQFWEYAGIAIFGLILFLFVSNYRKSFLALFSRNKKAAIGLNILAETVMVSADLVMNFATLLAPVVLIYVVNSFQPVFVFILGIALTLMFPRFIKESLSKKHVAQKVVTIFIMVIGLVMLYH